MSLLSTAPWNCSLHPAMAAPRLMLAHGFTIDLLVELVRAGLASVNTERVVCTENLIRIDCVTESPKRQRR